MAADQLTDVQISDKDGDGVEVKVEKPFMVTPEVGKHAHISQAALGEYKGKGTGEEGVTEMKMELEGKGETKMDSDSSVPDPFSEPLSDFDYGAYSKAAAAAHPGYFSEKRSSDDHITRKKVIIYEAKTTKISTTGNFSLDLSTLKMDAGFNRSVDSSTER